MEKQNKPIETLTDKAFSRLVFTSILAIFVCICGLCSTTYAWFVHTIPSSGNEIKMADECLLEVSVTVDEAELPDIERGVELEVGREYTVVLSLLPNTASGYCIITAGAESYYTEYIARHTEPDGKNVSFTLTVEETKTVTFTPRWGIYAKSPDILDGASVTI